jgi:DNA polymerase III subunit delta
VTKKSAPAAANLVLAVGKEPILVAQAIEHVMAAARKADPSTVRTDINAESESAAAELAQALSPSLFGELTVIVLTDLDSATDELAQVLTSSLEYIPENVRLVATHPGGVKGKKLLDLVRKAGALEANCAVLKGKDLDTAILAEFKKHGRKVTADAVETLHKAVGDTLGDLVAAVSQLCADVEEPIIDGTAVARYYEGVTDIKGWDLSDAMWNAKPVEVLEQLRWALAADSNAAFPIVISITNGLRSLIKFASAPASMRENELAGFVGVPPWRLKFLSTQKRKWNPEQLAAATRLLVLADRASKGTSYAAGLPGGNSLDQVQTRYLIEKHFLAVRQPTAE